MYPNFTCEHQTIQPSFSHVVLVPVDWNMLFQCLFIETYCFVICSLLVLYLFIKTCCFSTCLMLMRGWGGRPILCLLMTCVPRMQSCWRGSTGIPWSSTPQVRLQSSSWMNTKKKASKRPGKIIRFWSSFIILFRIWSPPTFVLLAFSFLDDAFRKNLESAVRFGNPLLVQVSVLTTRVPNIMWEILKWWFMNKWTYMCMYLSWITTGCWELWPHSEPCAEPWVKEDWGSYTDYPGRSGNRFLPQVHHLLVYQKSKCKISICELFKELSAICNDYMRVFTDTV